MNNNADFLAGENKEVCELSSESDSDSDSFYLVGGQSDSDSDSFIVVGDECDAKKVQDIKCEHSPVDEEGCEVHGEIKRKAPQDQLDTEYANIDNKDNSDENVTVENAHDVTSMVEKEVDQTGEVDNIINHKKKSAQKEVEFIDEEPGTTIAKSSEECPDKLCNVNNKIQTNEIRSEDNNAEVSKPSNSFEKDIEHFKDDHCCEANNMNFIEERTYEEKEFTEKEECTDEEKDFTDDEDEEITDDEQELSDDENEKPVTASTKHEEDGSVQFCKDILNSRTNTTEINQEENSLVVPEATNSVDKKINQLEDVYCNVTNSINNKKEYTDKEEECTDKEEECIDKEQEFSDKEEEFTNNKEKESATATTKHSEEGSEKFSENIVNYETKIKENNLVDRNSVIPETNIISIDKQNEGADDHCNETFDINIKGKCTDEVEECTDGEEDFTDEEEFSDDEEKEPVITTVKRNEDESDQFCKDIVNSETQVTEINRAENSSVSPDEKQEAAFPTTKPSQDNSIKCCEDMDNNETQIKERNLVENYLVVPEINKIVGEENDHVDDQCSESNNINIKEECSDEEEYTDEKDECSDEEEECTDEGVEFSDDEEKERATAATKFNEVESNQSCKDIINSETNTTEINLEESNSVIPVASNSVDKEIKQLEHNRRSVTDNVNNKEGLCTDDEEEYTDEEEECTDKDQEFTDEEDELTNNEEQELAIAAAKHNKDGSHQFCNDSVNSEMKTKEINLERSSPIVPDDNNSIYKEIKQVEGDRCNATENIQQSEDRSDELCEDIVNRETKSPDISLVESNKVVPEANRSTDVENDHCIETNNINIEAKCTDKEEEYTDAEEECTDEEEEYTDEEKQFTNEENLVTAITKHNQNESDEFCKAIVKSETNTTTRINLERSSPIVHEENNIIYKEIKQVEGDRWNATENIQQSEDRSDELCEDIVNKETKLKEISLVQSNSVVPEANKSIDVENDHCNETNNINIEAECTDEEEGFTDEEEPITETGKQLMELKKAIRQYLKRK